MSDISPYSPENPPKTLTEIHDYDFPDFTRLHTWLVLAGLGFCLYLFTLISVSTPIYQGLYTALILLTIAIWYLLFSTLDKVDYVKMRINFFITEKQGHHTINKFDVPMKFLSNIVSIVDIHHGGMIEFKGKKYGVLLETKPVKISDEQRKPHERRIQKVVNGVSTNLKFQTIAVSRLQPRKPILKYLLDVAGKSNGNKATDLHLSALYNKVREDDTPIISWKYYTFLSLGEGLTVNEARIVYEATIPGLLKNMRMARLQPRVYEDENEIATAYRIMFREMII